MSDRIRQESCRPWAWLIFDVRQKQLRLVRLISMNEEKVSETKLVTELKALKWAVVLAGAIIGFSLCIVTAGPRAQIAGGVVAFIAGVGALVGMLRNRSMRA